MDIILSRHGNTFSPGQPVVWTGSANDLPLVEEGILQARKLASVLKAQDVNLEAIYCSPLKRTLQYASILIEALNLPFQPRIDPRINEIDYGKWTGLTNEQVVAKFGSDALKNWDERSQWPKNGEWGSSEQIIIEEVRTFIKDLIHQYKSDSRVLVISSNGRLRYFLKLIEGEFQKRVENRTIKIRTGNICKIISGDLNIISYWNREPAFELRI